MLFRSQGKGRWVCAPGTCWVKYTRRWAGDGARGAPRAIWQSLPAPFRRCPSAGEEQPVSGGRGRAAWTTPPGGHCLPALPGSGPAVRRRPSVRPEVGELRRVRPTPAARASFVLHSPPRSLPSSVALLPRGRDSRLVWEELSGISTAGGRHPHSLALSALTPSRDLGGLGRPRATLVR